MLRAINCDWQRGKGQTVNRKFRELITKSYLRLTISVLNINPLILFSSEFDIHDSDIEKLLTPLHLLDKAASKPVPTNSPNTDDKDFMEDMLDEIGDDIEPKFLDIYTSIYSMRQDLEKMRKPSGSRENPARTCKDLRFSHPKFKDGKFLFYYSINLLNKLPRP